MRRTTTTETNMINRVEVRYQRNSLQHIHRMETDITETGLGFIRLGRRDPGYQRKIFWDEVHLEGLETGIMYSSWW